MTKFFLTIIIPTLNEELYLGNLLADLTLQTYKHFEVIIIDGQSKDNTLGVAEKFSHKLSLTYILAKKRNVSFQRNLGGKKARGDFIAFLDADARVSKTFVENLKSHTLSDKEKIFIPELRIERNVLSEKFLIGVTNLIVRAAILFNKPMSTGGNIFVEKKLFLVLKGFSEDYYLNEDHDFVQRAFKNGYRVKMIHNAAVSFSFRRMNKDGTVRFLYEIVKSRMHHMGGGNPSDKIYAYDMGGEHYHK